ncbi:MalY/PatB family protein [Carnobacterium sp.]|uniref:MalY/PatB family protein n=1 Tax=Carnobacterium sp. TaxID=48221 RepID=UPI0028AEC49B|nr:MalY/PatB family protein [Carnobacterium sp.]
MKKSNFDEPIDRRGSYCTQWDYIEDRFGVSNLLPFTISDMDFAVPTVISEALKRRESHPVYGYTRWNHSDFKHSIIKWYEERFATKVDPDWIVYSPSVMYTISRLIELKSAIGDQIVIQTPAYDAFFKTIRSNKRMITENPLVYTDGVYSIDFNDLEKKLADEKTTIFLLCSPQNPTGRIWSKDELIKMIHLCDRYNVFLISDEIHMDIVREAYQHIPVIALTDKLEYLAICTSASKTFNTSGLIGSYAIIPSEKLQEEFLELLKNRDGLSSASIMGIESIMAGYNYGQEWVDELNDYISANLNLVAKYLKEHIPEIHFVVPESTFLAWIDISNLPFEMNDLQQALITIGKVAIMDGSIYGKQGKDFLRMNLGCQRKKVLEGLEGLKKAVDYLKKEKNE